MRTPGYGRLQKILLPEMTQLRTDGAGDIEMVVDDETDVGLAQHRSNRFGHAPDFLG